MQHPSHNPQDGPCLPQDAALSPDTAAASQDAAAEKKPAHSARTHKATAFIFLFNALGVAALACGLYFLGKNGQGWLYALALSPVALLQMGLFWVFYRLYLRERL
jgi:fatty acid desaturase